MYFGTTEPTGYKFVNGQALSRTEYAELFNLIGTTYGAGDESTTFNLPDMSGKVPVGLNVNKEWFNQLGKTGGSEEVTLTIEQIPNHTHSVNLSSGDETGINKLTTSSWSWSTQNQQNNGLLNPTGGGQAHTNLQPYITVNYIMKVKNVASENVIVPDNFPIGGEISYSANTLPDNSWVWSDTNYLISDYPELAALYDGIFDDDTTQDGYFKTPKKAGLVTVGLDPNDTDFNTIGKTAGEKEHTLTINEMPKHSHHFPTVGINNGQYGYNVSSLPIGSEQNEYTSQNGGDQPHNNIQPSIVSRFIIKAKRIEPNMTTVIGANDTPNDIDVYSSNATKKLINDVSGTILWTNPNPTVSFEEQDITLNENIENYDEYIVLAKTWRGNTNIALSTRVPISYGAPMLYTENTNIYQRFTSVPSVKTLHIGSSPDNSFLVPIYVIGYKTGLFGDSNG